MVQNINYPVQNGQSYFRAQMQAMLDELLAQLDELERTGYSNWEIIGLVIAKLNIYSAQLNDGVILPLQGLQGVDKAHSKLKAILEKIQAKAARNEQVSQEDAKEFAEAITELKTAIQELKDNLPQDNLGQPIYPNNQYKDLVERLEQNLNKILKQEMPNSGGSIGDLLENLTPENLVKIAKSLNIWALNMRDHGEGPFKEWDEGKDGFATLRLELQTMVSEFSDKLNRDSQMITSLNSMAQKQIELVAALTRAITANQLSR